VVNKTILLTGAAGFIGSHTAERLIARGDTVIGLDNFDGYYSPAQKRENIRELLQSRSFSLIEGDIRDVALVRRLFSEHRFDAVVHLAAMAGVRASVEDPATYFDVNLTGTLTLLEAARREGRPNFIFASTSSAYGRTERIPFVETDRADLPLAPYPASKRCAELLGHCYHHMHGMDFTAVRFFTVYGPRNRPDMLPYLVMDSMRKGLEFPLYEGGDMHRDWTYVGDVADGLVSAVDRRLGYEVINLGRGEPVRLLDFIARLSALSGAPAKTRAEPMPAADVAYTFANIDKARRLLGYNPVVSVDEGVRSFFHWYEGQE
jgi:UDP-glucuronate 4-epimerase